jgi:NADH-quinone oxidoreductase subunit M
MSNWPWLTLLLVVPAGTTLLLQPLPRRSATAIKALTIVGALVNAAVVVGLLIAFTHNPAAQNYSLPQGGVRPSPLTFQFEEHRDWISSIGASYHLGLDGLSAWLLALDAGVFLLGAIVVSSRDTERIKMYCGLLLLTEAATMGVLLSLDLLLFYFFWEGMLIPLYFMLGFWGDRNRGRATLKFVIYTVAGSLLMLVSIIFIAYDQNGPVTSLGHPSFDLVSLVLNPAPVHDPVTVPFLGGGSITLLTPRQFAFLGFALAFAIKIPMVPFHTWLPDSYTSAPASVLTFFAGIVSKLGAFAFIRFGLTLFPGPVHDYRWIIEGLAIVSIVYAALLALVQTDIKRIVAYASISHLGFIVLGIFALNSNGLNGAILQMVNHGIIIASLFLIVGYIEERTGTRDIRELGGLERRMPWFYALFLVVTLAGLSMPITNGFAGEFLILLGAFQAAWVLAVLGSMGTILTAWYMLRLHQGVVHEPLQPAAGKLHDLSWGQRLVLLPLASLMILLGVFPKPVGEIARSNVDQYVTIATGPQPEFTAQAADRGIR